MEGLEEELHFCVDGLGQHHEIDGEKFFLKGDGCVESLKEILVYLKESMVEDSEEDVDAGRNVSRLVDKYLAEWTTMEKKLIPLLMFYREDSKIVSYVLRLLVVMTRPLRRCAPSVGGGAGIERGPAGSLENFELHSGYLQWYKKVLNSRDFYTLLTSVVLNAVQVLYGENSAGPNGSASSAAKTEARREMELAFTLVSHVLQIPNLDDAEAGSSSSGGVSVGGSGATGGGQTSGGSSSAGGVSGGSRPGLGTHMSTISHMNSEGILDAILLVGESSGQNELRNLGWVWFESLYHIVAYLDPKDLSGQPYFNKVDLGMFLVSERRMAFADVPKGYSRHSRFAPTNVIRSIEAEERQAAAAAAAASAKAGLLGLSNADQAASGSGLNMAAGPGLNMASGSGLNLTMASNSTLVGRNMHRSRELFYRHARHTADRRNIFADPSLVDIRLMSVHENESRFMQMYATIAQWPALSKDLSTFFTMVFDKVLPKLLPIVFATVQGVDTSIKPDLEKTLVYDVIRVINFLSWFVDYQTCAIDSVGGSSKNNGHLGAGKSPRVPSGPSPRTPSVKVASDVSTELQVETLCARVAWGVSQEALSIVCKHIRKHTKESTGMKFGGGNVIVGLRYIVVVAKYCRSVLQHGCVAEVFRVVDLLTSYDIIDNVLWIMKTYRPTSIDVKVIHFSCLFLDSMFRLLDDVKSIMDKNPSLTYSGEDSMSSLSLDSSFYSQYLVQPDLVSNMLHAAKVYLNMQSSRLAVSGAVFVSDAQKEGPLHSIASLLFRAMELRKYAVALFFNLSTLISVHGLLNHGLFKIVSQRAPRYAAFTDVLRLIVKEFVRTARRNKNVMLEALFVRKIACLSKIRASDTPESVYLTPEEEELEGVYEGYKSDGISRTIKALADETDDMEYHESNVAERVERELIWKKHNLEKGPKAGKGLGSSRGAVSKKSGRRIPWSGEEDGILYEVFSKAYDEVVAANKSEAANRSEAANKGENGFNGSSNSNSSSSLANNRAAVEITYNRCHSSQRLNRGYEDVLDRLIALGLVTAELTGSTQMDEQEGLDTVEPEIAEAAGDSSNSDEDEPGRDRGSTAHRSSKADRGSIEDEIGEQAYEDASDYLQVHARKKKEKSKKAKRREARRKLDEGELMSDYKDKKVQEADDQNMSETESDKSDNARSRPAYTPDPRASPTPASSSAKVQVQEMSTDEILSALCSILSIHHTKNETLTASEFARIRYPNPNFV